MVFCLAALIFDHSVLSFVFVRAACMNDNAWFHFFIASQNIIRIICICTTEKTNITVDPIFPQ